MLTSPDFKELLSLMETHGVEYLVVGGYAVMRYAEPRFTKELDLWISVSGANANAVFSALKDFGAPLAGLTVGDFQEAGYFYQMGRPPLRVDILMSIPGLSFHEAWPRREVIAIDGVSVNFISKADLMVSKQAAGRPQELLDLASLKDH